MKHVTKNRVVLFLLLLAGLLFAEVPQWWIDRGVVDTNAVPNDYAPVNQGQVKQVATQAYLEFDQELTNDCSAISNRIDGFSTTNNYLPANIGQLKYLTTPFYDLLWTNNYTNAWPDGMTVGPYPWSGLVDSPNDYALASIGQLKYLFSFDLSGVLISPQDRDGDGILNELEGLLGTDPDLADTDSDGASDFDELFPDGAITQLETFESDGLPDGWTTSGDAPWRNCFTESYFGCGSIVSGNIDDRESSTIAFSCDADTLSFYLKVSSEYDYDFLQLYIDGALIEEWSGEIDWTYEEFALDPGTNSVEFVYDKDSSGSTGDDCAWVDMVNFASGNLVTDPLNALDSDHDGIPDHIEQDLGLDPFNADDAFGDLDGDQFPNVVEFVYGTDLSSATSFPAAMVTLTNNAGGTIQSAIDQAYLLATNAYPIVRVCADTYQGEGNRNLTINGNLLLFADEGVTLDCEYADRAFNVEGGEIVIINGFSVVHTSHDEGAGVYAGGALKYLALKSMSFTDCSATGWGLIWLDTNLDVSLNGLSFLNCSSEYGILESSGNGELRIQDTYVSQCTSDRYLFSSRGDVSIENSRFTLCQIIDGQMFSFYKATVSLNSVEITGCSALSILNASGGDRVACANLIVAECDTNYGVFNFFEQPWTLSHSTIFNNRIKSSYRNAFGEVYSSNGLIEYSILWGNEGKGYDESLPDDLSIQNSIVEGGWSGSGTNIIIANPNLLNNFHLAGTNSPAIDAAIGSDESRDVDGEFRPAGLAPDIGADEFVDSDSDGLPDWWETLYDVSEATNDVDDVPDGLTNIEEYRRGTDPRLNDTDYDGASDYEESNLNATWKGSDPLDPDTDDDLMLDGYEIDYDLNPLDADDAYYDPDGDCIPTLYEYMNTTDPTHALSVPTNTVVVSTNGPADAYSSITNAIASASALSAYPIVRLEPGTYALSTPSGDGIVLANDHLLIYGTNAATVIDCENDGRAFMISSGLPVIRGLVMQNGYKGGYNSGGAIYCSGGMLRLINCVLWNNAAGINGGAVVAVSGGDVFLESCTMVGNTAGWYGGAINGYYCVLRNCLVWGNSASRGSPQIYATSVSYSCVEGWNEDNGNATNDPLVRVNSWRIGSTNSSCYRTGNPTNAPLMDIDGDLRGEQIDIGADVWVDTDGDGLPDWWEREFFTNVTHVSGSDFVFTNEVYTYEQIFMNNITPGTELSDEDGDELSNYYEICISHTDPIIDDTDNDDMLDGWEVKYRLNPLDEGDALMDVDGDHIPNVYEYMHGVFDEVDYNPTNVFSFPDPTVRVSTNGYGPTFPSIQSALAAAVLSNAYPIVLIEPGTYTGVGNKEITLSVSNILICGTNAATVIDCENNGRAFYITSGRPFISGLMIQNGNESNGGAVYVYGSVAAPKIKNCVFRNNQGISGGAVRDDYGHTEFESCTFVKNQASSSEGAVYGSATLRNCLVWGNTAPVNPQLHSASANYSCVEGWNENNGNTTNNPFIGYNSWRIIVTNSSCYGAGNSTNALQMDIDGDLRGGQMDVGADEWVDTDGDGLSDHWENETYGDLSGDGTGDADNDGLLFIAELFAGTNPDSDDTDGDGLTDGDEVHLYNTEPTDNDSDDDGLEDGAEITLSSDPNNNDSDHDGMTDGWEIENSFNPLEDDAGGDADSDGLTNLEEYGFGTDPHGSDTDDDGLTDFEEVQPTLSTDPLLKDTDGDFLSDGAEVLEHLTEPLIWDTDEDGMGDGFEVGQGLDPLVASTSLDSLDFDDDGQLNANEELRYPPVFTIKVNVWEFGGLGQAITPPPDVTVGGAVVKRDLRLLAENTSIFGGAVRTYVKEFYGLPGEKYILPEQLINPSPPGLDYRDSANFPVVIWELCIDDRIVCSQDAIYPFSVDYHIEEGSAGAFGRRMKIDTSMDGEGVMVFEKLNIHPDAPSFRMYLVSTPELSLSKAETQEPLVFYDHKKAKTYWLWDYFFTGFDQPPTDIYSELRAGEFAVRVKGEALSRPRGNWSMVSNEEWSDYAPYTCASNPRCFPNTTDAYGTFIGLTYADQQHFATPNYVSASWDSKFDAIWFSVAVDTVDIDVDADYDGSISEGDPDEALEVSSGGAVAVGEREAIILRAIDPSSQEGAATVRLEKNSGKIRVFDAETGGTEITFNGVDNIFLSEDLPKELYVQGESPSSTSHDITLTLTSDPGDFVDTVTFTVVSADLDVDSDHDGDIDDDDDPVEVSDGGLVAIGQLEPIKLVAAMSPGGALKLEAVSGGAKIQVWTDSSKSTSVTLPKTWTIGTDTVPTLLYVEGLEASAASRDIELLLRYTNGPVEFDDNITLTILKVEFIEPDMGIEIDDGDGDPDTRSFVVSMTETGPITVTAGLNPDFDEANLPADCYLVGGIGSDKLTRTLNIIPPYTYKTDFTFNLCGTDSGLKTTIYVYDTKYALYSARQSIHPIHPDLTGHAWWGFESDVDIKDVVPYDLKDYIKKGGFFCASLDFFGGPGVIYWDGAAQGSHYDTTQKTYPVVWHEILDGLTFVKAVADSVPAYHLIDNNCTDVAIEVGENANKPTMSRSGWTQPTDLYNWLISH